MRFDLLIRGGVCVLPWGEEQTDVGVLDGRVAALGDLRTDTAADVFDAKGLHVLPGLIDSHVHLRDPGDARVETLSTGTRGAVLGGIATVFDMPNTQPPIVDHDSLASKRAHAGGLRDKDLRWQFDGLAADRGRRASGTRHAVGAPADGLP
jgi:dihydroorotase